MRSLLVLLIALTVAPVFAANPEVKNQVQVVWQARELPLKVGMRQGLELPLPAVPPRDGFLRVLRVQSRLDTGANSGWNTFLALELNGTRVSSTQGDGRNAPPRVLNRDLLWKPPGMEQEEVVMRDNRLNVVFAPGLQAVRPAPRARGRGSLLARA